MKLDITPRMISYPNPKHDQASLGAAADALDGGRKTAPSAVVGGGEGASGGGRGAGMGEEESGERAVELVRAFAVMDAQYGQVVVSRE